MPPLLIIADATLPYAILIHVYLALLLLHFDADAISLSPRVILPRCRLSYAAFAMLLFTPYAFTLMLRIAAVMLIRYYICHYYAAALMSTNIII